MTVVLDTNALVQMFGMRSQHARLKQALILGELECAVSTSIWLEYEEVVVRYASRATWERIARIFDLSAQLHNNIQLIIDGSFNSMAEGQTDQTRMRSI